MSLDVTLTENRPVAVFKYNITHNLTKMADAVGLYEYLWRPEDLGITAASQLIEPLKRGLEKLEDEPERYNRFNPDNGWGRLYWVGQICASISNSVRRKSKCDSWGGSLTIYTNNFVKSC